jgi:hypothetical protein
MRSDVALGALLESHRLGRIELGLIALGLIALGLIALGLIARRLPVLDRVDTRE